LGSIWNEGNEGKQTWEQRSQNPRKSAQLPYAVYFLPSGVSLRRASFRRLQRWYALRLSYASILASALLCFVLFLFFFFLSSLQICVCLVSIKSVFLFHLGFRELMWALRIASVIFFPLVFWETPVESWFHRGRSVLLFSRGMSCFSLVGMASKSVML
jgi:hypothetical protein